MCCPFRKDQNSPTGAGEGESDDGLARRRRIPESQVAPAADGDAALFMSLLDRTNISFAALEMNADLGLSLPHYGRGARCRTCARRTRVRVETRAVIHFRMKFA
jgi:hypothetical protein